LKKYRHSLLIVVQATHMKNRRNTCAILRKARKFLQFEAVAGFQPSANPKFPLQIGLKSA